jgi:hypothetical protein
VEYRIKSGSDLTCEYTGNEAKTLIQIIDLQGSQSNWMSREALLDALKLLNALEGISNQLFTPVSIPVMPSSPIIPGKLEVTCANLGDEYTMGTAQTAPAVARPLATKRPDPDAGLVRSFHEDCQALFDEPPANHKGEPVLYESHIRDLVQRWKKSFRDPQKMLGPLNDVFGVSKERFQIIL